MRGRRSLWSYPARVACTSCANSASGDACLIPQEVPTYEKWRQYVYRVLRQAGVGRESDQTFHDLRRGYLCERMKFLMVVKGMDRARAAALVAREAGHHRLEILDWYLADLEESEEAA